MALTYNMDSLLQRCLVHKIFISWPELFLDAAILSFELFSLENWYCVCVQCESAVIKKCPNLCGVQFRI